MLRSYVNIGVFAKYPVGSGNVIFFPLFGIDYEISTSGELKYDNGKEIPLKYSTGATWLKLGGGIDFGLGGSAYLRTEILYGIREINEYEREMWPLNYEGWYRLGNGFTLKIGVGTKI